MFLLLIAWMLNPLHRALTELQAVPPQPEFEVSFEDLDTEFGTWPLRASLDDWWADAYGGVATRGEMQ